MMLTGFSPGHGSLLTRYDWVAAGVFSRAERRVRDGKDWTDCRIDGSRWPVSAMQTKTTSRQTRRVEHTVIHECWTSRIQVHGTEAAIKVT